MNNSSNIIGLSLQKSLPKCEEQLSGGSDGNRESDDVETEEGEWRSRMSENKRRREGSSTSLARWEEMFSRLLEFRRQHGHCRVPNRYPVDRELGAWVSTQRRQYKILISGNGASTPMTSVRANRLLEIGFKFAIKNRGYMPWESRFKELCKFVEKYGHAQIPMGWKENPRLSNWVSTQRQDYKLLQKGCTSRLTDERIKLLNEVGFVWEAQRGAPQRRRKGTCKLLKKSDPGALNKVSSEINPPKSTNKTQQTQQIRHMQQMQHMDSVVPLHPMQSVQPMQSMKLTQAAVPLAKMQAQTSMSNSEAKSEDGEAAHISSDDVLYGGCSQQTKDWKLPDGEGTVMISSQASENENPWQFVPAIPYLPFTTSSMPVGVMAPQEFFPFSAAWGWHHGLQIGMSQGSIPPNPFNPPFPFDNNLISEGTTEVESNSSSTKLPENTVVTTESKSSKVNMEKREMRKNPKRNFKTTDDDKCKLKATEFSAISKTTIQAKAKQQLQGEDPLTKKKREKKPFVLFGSESCGGTLKPFKMKSSGSCFAEVFYDADE